MNEQFYNFKKEKKKVMGIITNYKFLKASTLKCLLAFLYT